MGYSENLDFNKMRKEILHIENLSKSFNGLNLFSQVNLSIKEGTINSLFGNNGSGKTTFFNLIAGYEKPNEGKIFFDGMKIKYHDEFHIAHAGIGRMWQDPMIFPNHTVLQNMLVSSKSNPGEVFCNYFFNRKSIKLKEIELEEKAINVLSKLKLTGKENQLAGSLSLGERKLLSISMLLMNDANLLLLDEPFSNVNSNTIEKMSESLNEVKTNGKTIIMIEHKIKFAEAISDHCFCIQNQKIKEKN
jgi:neutral amino acid transport system ATP-binding protein